MTNGYEQARRANCNRLNFKEKKKEGKERTREAKKERTRK